MEKKCRACEIEEALDLIDECYHYLKANPPSNKTMMYSKWESLVQETDFMREYNANADHLRHNISERNL